MGCFSDVKKHYPHPLPPLKGREFITSNFFHTTAG
jgi:hypothetical protein